MMFAKAIVAAYAVFKLKKNYNFSNFAETNDGIMA